MLDDTIHLNPKPNTNMYLTSRSDKRIEDEEMVVGTLVGLLPFLAENLLQIFMMRNNDIDFLLVDPVRKTVRRNSIIWLIG